VGTKIESAGEIGFCFGVQRAIKMLEKAALENGNLETLGAVVHNEQVTRRLNKIGIKVINTIADSHSDTVAISSHGVSPQIEAELRARQVKVIDTTCPFVKRAQMTARRLAEAGFWVVVFGEAQHAEVKGILGWSQGKGIATLDTRPFEESKKIPRRLGILAQTTQIPENFVKFAQDMVGLALVKDSEIRIIDTICHDIRLRQTSSIDLSRKADLMLVVGGRSSANTKRLQELCSEFTETHQIETAQDIDPAWLKGKKHIGITSGTSTSVQTIDEVVRFLESIT
jgi:4-hydroxy-3-methylbut-2-en-1-yl diphosphate reductase